MAKKFKNKKSYGLSNSSALVEVYPVRRACRNGRGAEGVDRVDVPIGRGYVVDFAQKWFSLEKGTYRTTTCWERLFRAYSSGVEYSLVVVKEDAFKLKLFCKKIRTKNNVPCDVEVKLKVRIADLKSYAQRHYSSKGFNVDDLVYALLDKVNKLLEDYVGVESDAINLKKNFHKNHIADFQLKVAEALKREGIVLEELVDCDFISAEMEKIKDATARNVIDKEINNAELGGIQGLGQFDVDVAKEIAKKDIALMSTEVEIEAAKLKNATKLQIIATKYEAEVLHAEKEVIRAKGEMTLDEQKYSLIEADRRFGAHLSFEKKEFDEEIRRALAKRNIVGEKASSMVDAAAEARASVGVILFCSQDANGDWEEQPIGTGWLFKPHIIATNAHVHTIANQLEKANRGGVVVIRFEANEKHGARESIVRELHSHSKFRSIPDSPIHSHSRDCPTGVYDVAVGVLETEQPCHLDVYSYEEMVEFLSQPHCHEVMAIGYPVYIQSGEVKGFDPADPSARTKSGAVEKIADWYNKSSGDVDSMKLIDVDLPISEGFSGAPLIGVNGRVLGIIMAARVSIDGTGRSVTSGESTAYAQRVDVAMEALGELFAKQE